MEGRSAAADGRKEGNFVAGAQRRAPSDEFLVARGHHRGAIAREFRVVSGVLREKVFDGGTFGQVEGVVGATNNLLELAEKQDLDPDRLNGNGHGGIVTPEAGCSQRSGARGDLRVKLGLRGVGHGLRDKHAGQGIVAGVRVFADWV